MFWSPAKQRAAEIVTHTCRSNTFHSTAALVHFKIVSVPYAKRLSVFCLKSPAHADFLWVWRRAASIRPLNRGWGWCGLLRNSGMELAGQKIGVVGQFWPGPAQGPKRAILFQNQVVFSHCDIRHRRIFRGINHLNRRQKV